jgi:mono/diheme cytochrome c family protein
MKPFGIVVASVAATLVVIAAAAAAVIATGAYDVAADAPHTALVAKVIAIARERSIDMRASGINVPPLGDAKMIREGAEHYAAMCTGCHLAPGTRENAMHRGLNPKPPVLASLSPEDPNEQFWIIKHGLKMTAMPAWGATHSDAEIWNMVAFLQKLPGLSPAQYRDLTRDAQMHHEHMGG